MTIESRIEGESVGGPVYVSGWKRFYSALLNVILMVFLAIIIDRAFLSNAIKSGTGYETTKAEYVSMVERFSDLQDSYGIYTYDSSSSRGENPDVSEGQKEAFLNDPEVIRIKSEAPALQDQLLAIDIMIVSIDLASATLIGCLFGAFLFGKGRSLGAVMVHYDMTDSNGNKLKAKKIILYGFLKWVFYFVLGICSVLILPCVFFIRLYYDEKSQSPLDRWLGVEYRMMEKYIGD